MTFSDATGALSGTPGPGTGGTYPLTITAANGISPNATQAFSLIVDQAPAFTSANSTTFTVGLAGTFDVTASGFPAVTFGETGALPTGVSFSDATGVLSGTPVGGVIGTFPITFTASNGVGATASQSFSLVVVTPPLITSPNSATFVVGTNSTFTATVSGNPVPTLSESGTLPTGLSFNAATDSITGTPATGTGGTYTLTFTASNGVSPNAAQTFTLIVDELPNITSTNTATFTVGTAGTFSLVSTGFPAPTFNEAGTLPAGLGFTPTGILSGTPLTGSGGTYLVTFTPVNSVGVGLGQTFTIVVGEAPQITSAATTIFTVNSFGTFTETANGFPTASFTETGTLPGGVGFNNSTGVLSGTPVPGSGGIYPLVITPVNATATGPSQNFSLVVNEVPQITSANGATFTVGTNGTFTVTASGFPAAKFAEAGALPGGLTFDTTTGVLSGIPAAGSGGSYTLQFTPMNAAGTGNTQTFTLLVQQTPAITSANGTTFTEGSAGSFTVTATGFPTPTFAESGALPAGVTFDDTTGLLSGTPDAGTAGTYTLTLTAMNGVNPNGTQTFTLIVTA